VTAHSHLFGRFLSASRDRLDREWIVAQCLCGERIALLDQAREREAWDGVFPPEIATELEAKHADD
jgi:hypothetical protein